MYQDNSMNDGFLRQRRNLIISTLFVFFIHFTTIEIDKVSIFGISFDIIKKSDDILYGMYLIWGYFFIRYMQYFYDYGFGNFISNYHNLFSGKLDKKVKNYILIKVPNLYNIAEGTHFERIKRQNYKYYGRIEDTKPNEYGERVFKKVELDIPRSLFMIERIKVIFEVIFFKSMTTDFFLPIIMFLGTGLYILFR